MAYRISYKKSVEKELAALGTREARRVLGKIEKELSTRADAYPLLKGEFAGLRKLRVGDYRVVFAIIEGDVLVLRVGHRSNIYER